MNAICTSVILFTEIIIIIIKIKRKRAYIATGSRKTALSAACDIPFEIRFAVTLKS